MHTVHSTHLILLTLMVLTVLVTKKNDLDLYLAGTWLLAILIELSDCSCQTF